MFSIYGRDGRISMLRLGILGALIGVIVIVLGVASYFIDRASHQVPLDISPYPQAQRVQGEIARASNIRSIYYLISDATADQVAAYYQQQLDQFYGNSAGDQNREKCNRFPTDFDPGVDSPADYFPEYNAGNPDVPPYRYICLFDRSGFFITQFTQVTIEPGIQSRDTQGKVVVEYEQHWD